MVKAGHPGVLGPACLLPPQGIAVAGLLRSGQPASASPLQSLETASLFLGIKEGVGEGVLSLCGSSTAAKYKIHLGI